MIRIEEEAFNRTLDKGIALFETRPASSRRGGIESPAPSPSASTTSRASRWTSPSCMARERGLAVDVRRVREA
jgi:hypothetical protein